MSLKRIAPRPRAEWDIEQAIDNYRREAGEAVAIGFVDALEHAYRHIARYPDSGSTRYAYELGLPGLRSWLLKRYPYLIFFMEHDDHIDVWRVLHAERDIPAWLRDPSGA